MRTPEPRWMSPEIEAFLACRVEAATCAADEEARANRRSASFVLRREAELAAANRRCATYWDLTEAGRLALDF